MRDFGATLLGERLACRVHPAQSMIDAPGRVLVVDDDEDTALLLCEGLRKRGFDVDAVTSASATLEYIDTTAVDVIVTDVHMAGMSGIELCQELRQHHPEVILIVLTAQSWLETAISAIRAGVFDFILKPVKIEALAIAVGRALEQLSLGREIKRLRAPADVDLPIEKIVGTSSAIRETRQLMRRVANSDASVLITGESGTGKELVARAIHELSPRRDEPFVAINCAAMPATLLESELFGHVRGAFTDAKRSRPGLFVQAGAGTIFLDEIGEMPLEMQVKLLRALQARRVRPVGADEELPFQARVISATNRDLEIDVKNRRFRADLLYRIDVVTIPVPPLRARSGDVLLLAHYFLQRIAARTSRRIDGISGPAAHLLMDYDWPGNVRELENSMERAVALSRHDQITGDDLPAKIQEHEGSRMVIGTETPGEMLTLHEMELRYIRSVLRASRGNKTASAHILGIPRRSLYRWLEGGGDGSLGARAKT